MPFPLKRIEAIYRCMPRDKNGMIPEEGDAPWDLDWYHGEDETHDEWGNLTDYGRWWESEGFPDQKALAVRLLNEDLRMEIEWVQMDWPAA